MDEEEKRGTPWQDDELDAIVADYFVMLASELAGEPYTKSRHSARLMAQIGRSHRSVEFKHQNISAVLEELGMPWIPGYRPKKNYQNAIFDAIDRYLTHHPASFEQSRSVPVSSTPIGDVFVASPSLGAAKDRVPNRLRRLVQKFDPVERDHRNRSLGRAGEAFVVGIEKRKFMEAKRADLAQKVRWIADEEGDGAGFDVLSFEFAGEERLIEVKTTNGSARTPFFITRNEYRLAVERCAYWCIYRVHLFAMGPRVFTIEPPLEKAVKLATETWRASF
jgi:hypothetical protein